MQAYVGLLLACLVSRLGGNNEGFRSASRGHTQLAWSDSKLSSASSATVIGGLRIDLPMKDFD